MECCYHRSVQGPPLVLFIQFLYPHFPLPQATILTYLTGTGFSASVHVCPCKIRTLDLQACDLVLREYGAG